MLLSVKNTHRKHGVEAVCTLKTKEKKEKTLEPQITETFWFYV